MGRHLMAVAVLCLLASPVLADSRWVLRIEAVPRRVLPQEPVLVTGTLTYRGTDPFQGYAYLMPGSASCTDINGKGTPGSISEHDFAGPSDPLAPAVPFTYQPGEAKTQQGLLLCSAGGADGLQPGTCFVRMTALIEEGPSLERYRYLQPELVPAVVTVRPLPEGEREALRLWSGRAKAGIFLSGWVTDPAALDDLKQLVQRYPQSAYANYARMALAEEVCLRRDHLRVNNRVAAENEDEYRRLAREEADLLQYIVDHSPGFALRPVVEERLKQAGWALQRK